LELGRGAAVSSVLAAVASVLMGRVGPSVLWCDGSVSGGQQPLVWVLWSRHWVTVLEVLGVQLVGAVVKEGISSSLSAVAAAA